MNVNEINKSIQELSAEDRQLVSDGYHSFGELYEHRIVNYIAILRIIFDRDVRLRRPWHMWRSKMHSDGSSWDGWFILGIYTEPDQQITYHLPIEKWDECSFAQTLERAPEYDGHTSEDVIKRIKSLQ